MTFREWLRSFWWTIPIMMAMQGAYFAQGDTARLFASLFGVTTLLSTTSAWGCWQLVKVNRKRAQDARVALLAAKADLDYATEKGAQLIGQLIALETELMHAQGRLRVYEMVRPKELN